LPRVQWWYRVTGTNQRETGNAIKDGWLYTGDVGKMDESGWVYIIDRKKDLINASAIKFGLGTSKMFVRT